MPTFYDSQNNALTLGERLGGGGEGTVYSCDNFALVAKIYHEPIDEEKAEKLRWMAANKNESLLKVAAWVVDVLHDQPDGKIVGFTMPNVKAKEIHELYSLKSRRVYFPEATWHFLVHTAANVARAFYNLHRDAHIMGDVNHGNCVVLADGTVKLIDCDSYSIKTDKMRYPCEVGVATHLAPELQGVDLGEVEREEKHDNFGLAVIIFQLLFLGRHPFAGNYLGDEDKSIEDCIREFRFAYGDDAEYRKVRQPPGTLSLSSVSPRVALMFERAFLTEDRPEPREWIEALGDLEENLEQCRLHPGHFYFNELKNCPWCEIESQTGLMLFPFVTGGKKTDGEQPFNIFTVESLIASFGIGENLPVKPSLPSVLPPPATEIVEARQTNRKMMLISVASQFFGLIFLMVFFGVGIAFFIGICAMVFWIIYTNNSSAFWGDDQQNLLLSARQDWETFEDQWRQNLLPQNLDDNLTNVRKKLADYQNFQRESIQKGKHLHDDIERRELFRHLRSVPLDEAEIEDFDEQERQWLIGKGVETAAEVTENRIRSFNDFNGEIVPKLLEWRDKIELEYQAAPRRVFKDEEENFAKETARERRRIEIDIEHSLGILRSGAVNLRRHQQEFSEKSATLASRFLQAKSNAEALGSRAPIIVVLVLITILTPYFGFIISQINAPAPNPPVSTRGSEIISAPPKPVAKNDSETENLEVLLEKITDKDIALMSGELRTEYADRLFTQATELAYEDTPEYDRAEKKMRLAIRLEGNSVPSLNQLGYILYEEDKTKESLKYLNQSLKIDESNIGTKIYISDNYLKMKRFGDARQLLNAVVNQYPDSLEIRYNLGLAYEGLNDYKSAINYLEQAADIDRDDVDTHYELAFCYHKVGDISKFSSAANRLNRLDSKKSTELYVELGIATGEGSGSSISPPPPPPPAKKTTVSVD